MKRPALLGAPPLCPEGLPIARPAAPPLARVVSRLQPSYDRGVLTNGPLTRQLEEEVAARLGVAHVVGVASCTAGLVLALQALAPRDSVALPSFTFSASAHAVAWNRLRPVFVECSETTFQVDVADLDARGRDAGALLATHVFGAPCAAEEVEALGRSRGVPVVFDAAHGLGASRGERTVGGFGDAEVFSMSPTKLVVAGEGGLVATNRDDVAEHVRVGRDYGNPGDYDTRFVGLNARLSELHAAMALESLAELDEHLERRRSLAARYRDGLAAVPGVRVQTVGPGDQSTYKDFTIAIDADEFGAGREDVVAGLAAEGIETRRYFWPPVHRQQSHRGAEGGPLPVTDRVASQVVSLPMFRDLDETAVDTVVEAIASLQAHAAELATATVV